MKVNSIEEYIFFICKNYNVLKLRGLTSGKTFHPSIEFLNLLKDNKTLLQSLTHQKEIPEHLKHLIALNNTYFKVSSEDLNGKLKEQWSHLVCYPERGLSGKSTFNMQVKGGEVIQLEVEFRKGSVDERWKAYHYLANVCKSHSNILLENGNCFPVYNTETGDQQDIPCVFPKELFKDINEMSLEEISSLFPPFN